MITICESIKEELKILKNRVDKNELSCKEIAQKTGVNATKIWRTLNNVTKIDFFVIEQLEIHEYIHPMKSFMSN